MGYRRSKALYFGQLFRSGAQHRWRQNCLSYLPEEDELISLHLVVVGPPSRLHNRHRLRPRLQSPSVKTSSDSSRFYTTISSIEGGSKKQHPVLFWKPAVSSNTKHNLQQLHQLNLQLQVLTARNRIASSSTSNTIQITFQADKFKSVIKNIAVNCSTASLRLNNLPSLTHDQRTSATLKQKPSSTNKPLANLHLSFWRS